MLWENVYIFWDLKSSSWRNMRGTMSISKEKTE
jgi:hypothetical protein